MNSETNPIEDLRAKTLQANSIFVSFCKSGRTWCRYFLAKYLEGQGENFESKLDFPTDIFFTHNFFDIHYDNELKPKIYFPDIMHDKKTIVLVRDPRDVAVSYFYQITRRQKMNVHDQDLESFLLSPKFGIERHSQFVIKLLDFANDKNKDNKLILLYENIVNDSITEFRKFIRFIFDSCDENLLKKAVRDSKFSNMRSYEIYLSSTDKKKNYFGSDTYSNDNFLKTRKGKVGSYKEELTTEFISYISGLKYTGALIDRLESLKTDV